jgi:DNA-binding beta-propeller fold protein YncE
MADMAGKGTSLWRVATTILGAVVVAILLGLAWLVVPLAPRSTPHMAFEGFIVLPKDRALAVMDYVTINDHTLFVTGALSGNVDKVDLGGAGGSAVASLAGAPRAHGVAIADDLGFVTRSEVNRVEMFDPVSLKTLGQIPVADDADAILYDAPAKLLYVANGDAKLATLIDPATRGVAGTIALGAAPEFPALDPVTGLIYQNLNDANEVAAVDVQARKVVGRWSIAPCQAPTGLAIDPQRRRLFAVCGKNALLVVFDLTQHRVVARAKVGGGPDAVAFDPSNQRLYTAGLGGELTVIQQGAGADYSVIDRIATHYGAHTLGLDPATHRVYLAYASLLLPPRLAVFAPR